MTDYGPYKVHPLADAFPLIEGEEFDQLVDDVRRNGLGNPIVLSADETTIVDGRNRYRACDAAMVDPVFRPLPASFKEEQIVDFIVSENVHRRHMSTGQRAMLALKVESAYAEIARQRQAEAARRAAEVSNRTRHSLPANQAFDPFSTDDLITDSDRQVEADLPQPTRAPQARDRAAKALGTSGRAVQQAKRVNAAAPDLAAKVQSGALALDAAERELKRREAEAKASRPAADPVPTAPKPGRAEPIMLTLHTHDGQEVPYPKPAAKPKFNDTTGPGISWAAWSWNPVTGCLHGCDYCYAREIATSDRYSTAYPVGFTPLFHPERLDAPVNTVPTDTEGGNRVFVCSMADLYGRWVPDEWIEQVHAVERDNPQWEYLHLTKFPSRYVGLDLPATAWIGTSVDEQKRVRIAEDAFRKIDGVKVKWLSLEPLLEPLEFTDLSMFDWVVIGAQTGTAQPGKGYLPGFAPDFVWVSDLVQQARESGCRVHLKPNLFDGKPGMRPLNEYPDSKGR